MWELVPARGQEQRQGERCRLGHGSGKDPSGYWQRASRIDLDKAGTLDPGLCHVRGCGQEWKARQLSREWETRWGGLPETEESRSEFQRHQSRDGSALSESGVWLMIAGVADKESGCGWLRGCGWLKGGMGRLRGRAWKLTGSHRDWLVIVSDWGWCSWAQIHEARLHLKVFHPAFYFIQAGWFWGWTWWFWSNV